MDLYEAMNWWGTISRETIREGFGIAIKNSYKVVMAQSPDTKKFIAAGRMKSNGIRYGSS